MHLEGVAMICIALWLFLSEIISGVWCVDVVSIMTISVSPQTATTTRNRWLLPSHGDTLGVVYVPSFDLLLGSIARTR